MLKRKNPFQDPEGCIQVKTFVNQRFMDVNSEERMQIIHERTKKLLFDGSEIAFSKVNHFDVIESSYNCLNLNPRCDNGGVFSYNPHKTSKQLVFSSDNGELSFMKNEFLQENHDFADDHTIKCHPCGEKLFTDNEVTRFCSWCNSIICPHCVRRCGICQNLFCYLCSLLDYSGSDEVAYCFQCRASKGHV